MKLSTCAFIRLRRALSVVLLKHSKKLFKSKSTHCIKYQYHPHPHCDTHFVHIHFVHIYMHTLYPPPSKGEGGRSAPKAQDIYIYIYKIHFMAVSLRRLPGQPRPGKAGDKTYRQSDNWKVVWTHRATQSLHSSPRLIRVRESSPSLMRVRESFRSCVRERAQELCESRDGRSGLLVPLCGRKATMN